MFTTRKAFLIVLAIVAVLSVGAFAVFAQDDGTTPPFGRGGMMGRGMHGAGMGMMAQDWDVNEHPMFVAVAGALGVTPEELQTAFAEGKTVAVIAEENGVELQAVYDAALATATQHIASHVEEGVMTQEQADARLAWMQENIASMPIFGEHSGGMHGAGRMMGGMHGGCPMGSEMGATQNGMHGMGRWNRGGS